MSMTQEIQEKMGPLSEEDKARVFEMADNSSDQRVEFIVDRILTGETFDQACELANQHNYL